MNAPLYNELMAYSDSKLAFHMPGHKFGTVAELDKLSIISLDNTEAIGLDNLYEADGIIKSAMTLMAQFYDAKSTVFLTNGSTSGILASILATCREGDKLIVARNAHHSVWSALTLAGVIPIYISPIYLCAEDLLGEITVESVEEAFNRYPEAKGVIIVSPTYEGIVSDVEGIAGIVHRRDKLLIVDEAHGAHFVLGEEFPKSSIKCGADIVINSMHKTLPALTQSALLHICSDRVGYEEIITSLRMIQTSSPSYMMMGLMDYIRCYISEHHIHIKHGYIDELIKMRKRLAELNILRLITKDSNRYDISKIIISTRDSNISGYELAGRLNSEYNIVVEAALDSYIILMTTMADQEETLTKLEEALKNIDKNLIYSPCKHIVNDFMIQKVTLGYAPRKIHYSNKEWVNIKQCQGRKLANNIMLYPPGIPLICIGEQIEDRHINIIKRFKDKLQGIKNVDKHIYLYIAVGKEYGGTDG